MLTAAAEELARVRVPRLVIPVPVPDPADIVEKGDEDAGSSSRSLEVPPAAVVPLADAECGRPRKPTGVSSRALGLDSRSRSQARPEERRIPATPAVEWKRISASTFSVPAPVPSSCSAEFSPPPPTLPSSAAEAGSRPVGVVTGEAASLIAVVESEEPPTEVEARAATTAAHLASNSPSPISIRRISSTSSAVSRWLTAQLFRSYSTGECVRSSWGGPGEKRTERPRLFDEGAER